MDYTKNVMMVVLFLVTVVISRQGTLAQTMPKDDPVCTALIQELLVNCFTSGLKPTEACCNDLKSATTKQVNCACDMLIIEARSSNMSRSTEGGLPSLCGVADKYSCGLSLGGAMNKVVAPSVVLFGLVASLFLVMS